MLTVVLLVLVNTLLFPKDNKVNSNIEIEELFGTEIENITNNKSILVSNDVNEKTESYSHIAIEGDLLTLFQKTMLEKRRNTYSNLTGYKPSDFSPSKMELCMYIKAVKDVFNELLSMQFTIQLTEVNF